MIFVKILVFIGLMVACMVGMGYLMGAHPGLNVPAFNISGFNPHWSTLLWAFGFGFSAWVATSIK